MGDFDVNQVIQEAGMSELEGMSLTFFIDDTVYGLPLSNVLEIINVQPVARVPGTPGHIKGVINLRGNIVPMMDARARFGQAERAYDDQSSFIIMKLDDVQMGLAVDRVSNVVKSDETNTAPLPEFGNVNTNKYIRNTSRADENIVMNLNVETLLG